MKPAGQANPDRHLLSGYLSLCIVGQNRPILDCLFGNVTGDRREKRKSKKGNAKAKNSSRQGQTLSVLHLQKAGSSKDHHRALLLRSASTVEG